MPMGSEQNLVTEEIKTMIAGQKIKNNQKDLISSS